MSNTGFEPGRTGAAFSGRRRNGSVRDGGYDYATLQLRCPVEASPQRHIVADSPFRDAMNARWDSDLGRQLRRAIWWFTRANTDSPTVPQQAEVKMMGTAFEVLTAPQGMAKAAPIRDAIGDLLAFDWVSCPGWRARAKRHDEAQVQPWTTFQFWWNDFYRLRNAIEHEGHDTGEVPADCPRWNAFQHLMVATIVFPHLVRAVLARDGADPCDGEEVRRLQALEGLLLQPGFRWNGNEKFEDLVKAAEERWFRIAISGAIHKHMPPTRTTS